jgi:hypothetical protein
MDINSTKSVKCILRASTSMPYKVASNAILGCSNVYMLYTRGIGIRKLALCYNHTRHKNILPLKINWTHRYVDWIMSSQVKYLGIHDPSISWLEYIRPWASRVYHASPATLWTCILLKPIDVLNTKSNINIENISLSWPYMCRYPKIVNSRFGC